MLNLYKMSSDGTEVTLSNDNRYGVYVNFYDYNQSYLKYDY